MATAPPNSSTTTTQMQAKHLDPWKTTLNRWSQASKIGNQRWCHWRPKLLLTVTIQFVATACLQCRNQAYALTSSEEELALVATTTSLDAAPMTGNGRLTETMAATNESTTTSSGGSQPVMLVMEENNMKFPLYMRTVATLACLIIFTIGVCGNLLVPLVVIKTKYLRNSTNLFLINLSIADLLVLIVCMPTVLIELHSRPETWLLGEPMCKISNYVETLAANGSIFTILAISFERYYAICKPLKAGYKCTRLRATVIICTIWLLASILTSPILIMAKSSETSYIDGSLVYNCILETDSYWAKMYVFVSMFGFFCLPLIVLMLVYWLISKRLIRENLAMSCCSSAGSTIISREQQSLTPATPGQISSANSSVVALSPNSPCVACSQRLNHSQYDHYKQNASMLNGVKSLLFMENGTNKRQRMGALCKVGSGSKCISTLLPNLHQHHCNPPGCRAVDTTCTMTSIGNVTTMTKTSPNAAATADANEPISIAAKQSCQLVMDKRRRLVSNKALSLDPYYTIPCGDGLEQNQGQANGEPAVAATICSDMPAKAMEPTQAHSGKASRTFCGIPMRKCSQTISLVSNRNIFYRFLHFNRDGSSSDNEIDDLPQQPTAAVSFDYKVDAPEAEYARVYGRATHVNRIHSTDGTSESAVTDATTDGSQAPFIHRDDNQSPNRRRRKLQSKKTGLKSPISDKSNKFKWMKRFSISSSTVSVQTSSTTLPSDASVSPSTNSSSQAQRSPRSILQNNVNCNGLQSRELKSNNDYPASATRPERKKTAHFDSDVIDITDSLPEDEVCSPISRQKKQMNSCSSCSGSPSSSPEMSKSSSPESMFRHDIRQACSANTSLPVGSSNEIPSEEIKTTKSSSKSPKRESPTARRTAAGPHIRTRLTAKKAGSLDMTNYRREFRTSITDQRNYLATRCTNDSRMHGIGAYSFFKFGRTSSAGGRMSESVVCNHAHNHGFGQSPEMLAVRDLSKKQQMDSRRQVVIMLAFVVTCFFLLFFPYRVFTIWLILSTEDQVQSLGMETYYNLTYFSRILIYLHSAINPIAYNLISTKFRRAFMSVLFCRGSASRRQFTTEHRILNNRASSEDKKQSIRQSYRLR